jgi:hypothetical protein
MIGVCAKAHDPPLAGTPIPHLRGTASVPHLAEGSGVGTYLGSRAEHELAAWNDGVSSCPTGRADRTARELGLGNG